MEDEDEVNKNGGEVEEESDQGEWRITTTTGGTGDHHHHAHIVTVMTSADELEGGGGSTAAAFVPVTFETGGRGGTGEVRLIQVPISMLPPNFHFLHSTAEETHHQEDDDSSNQHQQLLGQGTQEEGEEGPQEGDHEQHLAVTLVETIQSGDKDLNASVGVIHHHEGQLSQQHVVGELSVENTNVESALLVPQLISQQLQQQHSSILPSLRSRRSRPIRKQVYERIGGSSKRQEGDIKPGAPEEEIGTTGKVLVGPKWPEDKCANCAVEFMTNDGSNLGDEDGGSQNISVAEKSSHLKIQEELILNHEALQYVFNIKLGKGKESSSSSNEICWLCRDCSKVLEELYVACRAFIKLTKEEAFLYKRLRTKVIQAHQHQKTINIPSSSPVVNISEVDLGERVEVKVELHEYGGGDEDEPEEEEEDEWITGDVSDDEDFRASPTDLEKAEISSESSESDVGDHYHHQSHGSGGGNKRKSKDLMGGGGGVVSPKKKRSSKNKSRGDSFWWDSNNKTDSDDSNLGWEFIRVIIL